MKKKSLQKDGSFSITRMPFKQVFFVLLILFSANIYAEIPSYSTTGIVSSKPPVVVKGTVKDEKGVPLPGVSIKERGTTNGTQTDTKGNFSIRVGGQDSYLEISFIGFLKQEIRVGSHVAFQIILHEDVKALEEVVVVGYGTQKRASVTGSVATVKGKELIVTKNENTVNMLTGKVPGLRIVQRTAEPGGYDNNLNIRGFKSDPLVVIDGVPKGVGDFSRMDPNEIENVSVLKDGSAAIYGVRAAGGVILVTTKKGDKNGKVDINYSINQGFQQFLGMPEGVDAVDYMMLTNEKMKRDFANNFLGNQAPQYSYENILPYMDGTYPSSDWIGLAFKKSSPQIQHNLNVNGGTEKLSYFFNLGYMKQDGVFKSNDLDYSKYNFRSNVTANITKGLTAQVLASGLMDEKNQPYQDQWTIFKYAWNQIPTKLIYANNNPEYPNWLDDNINPAIVTDADKVGFRKYLNKSFNGQLSLQYDIPGVKGLNAKAMYSYAYSVGDNTDRKKEYTLYIYDAEKDLYNPTQVGNPATIRRSYYTGQSNLAQLSLNYAKTFFIDHTVSATFVYEQSHSTNDSFFGQRNIEMPIDYLFAGLADDSQTTGMNGNGEVATKSIAGRFNYDYKGKYLAEFVFRRDGSNKYMPGSDQWGFFPGGSVGWVLTKESFFRNLISENILTSVKLRASYGQVGDEEGRGFNYVNGYNYPVDGYIFGPSYVNGSSPRLGNPGLSWAVNTKKNIGLDFTLFRGKLDGTVEVFRSDRTGIAAANTAQVPGTVGAEPPQININSDRVQGIDFIITHRNKIGEFGLNATANISTTRAMTRFLVQGRAGNEYDNWKNGQINRYQNIWWGKEYAGQFTSYDQIYNYPVNQGGGNNGIVPGDYYYTDWNEDGEINGKDEHPIATSDIPLVNFGLNLGLTYKGFDLNVLLQGATGVYVQYGEQYAQPLMYNRSALTRFLDSWHTVNPDDNVFDPNTQWVPGYYPAMGSDYGVNTTRSVQDAKYLRIKSLELGYTIPVSILQKIGIKRLRVYANGYNLATFTGLKNYDPEHPGEKPGTGFDDALGGYKYPMNRTYNVGANISF